MKSKLALLIIFGVIPFCLIESKRPTLEDFPRIEDHELKTKLTDFCFNEFSQFGEDGIIEKIFEIIGTTSKIAIEFGAYDGIYCSNVARLWKKKGWKAILIEGDKKRFKKLIENTKNYDCLALCQYIGIEPNNNIEAILRKIEINDEIDLLSIDIDGNDYYVFQSLQELKPRVVILEYNPTIPATLDAHQPYDPESKGSGFGASVAALNRIAQSKGYSLIAITICNCIFIRNDLSKPFNQFETSLRKIQFEGFLKYITTDFSGKYMILGTHKLAPFSIGETAPIDTLTGKVCKFPSQLKISNWTNNFS